jgi:hypothetical protein
MQVYVIDPEWYNQDDVSDLLSITGIWTNDAPIELTEAEVDDFVEVEMKYAAWVRRLGDLIVEARSKKRAEEALKSLIASREKEKQEYERLKKIYG